MLEFVSPTLLFFISHFDYNMKQNAVTRYAMIKNCTIFVIVLNCVVQFLYMVFSSVYHT